MTITPHLKHVILAILAAGMILLITWKVLAHMDLVDHDQVVLAQQQLKVDQQTAKTQAATTKTDDSALQRQVNILTASNRALVTSVASLQQQLASQRSKDAAMAPDALSARWQSLINAGSIQVQPSGILADLTASHATVDKLESLPVLRAELDQTKANSAQKDKAILGEQNLVADVQAELGTCKKVTQDADAACQAQIKEVKASARKRAFWYAIGSFISGIIAGRKI
jgi:hypothetical protein